jgi:pimeloyl-ACP methyl ester carboxylesterase
VLPTPITVVSRDGTSIAAYDLGGEGRPLLLAHATGFHAGVFLPLVGELTAIESGFHCYAFDERGHGHSEIPPTGDFDWHRFAEYALAVAAAFKLDRPAAFGHSCGGALLLLAELAQPGCWSQGYAYEPVVPPSGWLPDETPPTATTPQNPLSAGALRRRTNFPSRDAAYDNFASKPPFDVLDPAALRAYVDDGFAPTPDGDVTLTCRPESEAATYEGSLHHHAWQRLGDVSIPVTVASGLLSGSFSEPMMREVAGRIPSGHYVAFPQLGHFGPLEDPAAVARSVVETLRPDGR